VNETTRGLQQTASNPSPSLESESVIWVRPSQAARLCGVRKNTIYNWINDGTVESRIIGRIRLIRRLDLERLGR
jgi:excisionase family DNA binding protein